MSTAEAELNAGLIAKVAMQAPEFPDMLRAVGDKIVVVPAAREKQIGNIIVPDNAQQKSTRGFVVAVGPGAITAAGLRCPPDVAQGEWVAYKQYAGTAVDVGGQELVVLAEADILFVY